MNKLLASLITLFTITGLQAQPREVPRLIVGLTIDQLRTDYMEAFTSLYGEKGLKKLCREALYYRNVKYGFSPRDRSSVIASVYTGTTPSVHGIISDRWFNPSILRVEGCVDDAAYIGNYTGESSSPLSLLSSTMTDELKIFTQHKGKVYAISPFRDAAVLSAGHAPDGAFWLNINNGKWSSSTYYGEFPYWASIYNNSKALDSRIFGIEWKPLYNASQYTYLPVKANAPFRHKFSDGLQGKYRLLSTSPYVNDEVNRFAEYVITSTSMGKDTIPDMLCLTYYAGNYEHNSDNTMEIQDAYIRMDNSIGSLLDMLDKKVGLQHVLFFVTSTGYVDDYTKDAGSFHIPSGEFNMKRCVALLNMYMAALYGNGQYIESYYGNQIYLNHKLIEQKHLDLETFLDKATSFLTQFTGVKEAYSSNQLRMGSWNAHVGELSNGYNRFHSGDLCVEVLPGWTFIDEQNNINKVVRSAYVPSPLIILGGSFQAATIDTLVDADCIAPTVCSCLHIRAPNSSTAAPLTNNVKE